MYKEDGGRAGLGGEGVEGCLCVIVVDSVHNVLAVFGDFPDGTPCPPHPIPSSLKEHGSHAQREGMKLPDALMPREDSATCVDMALWQSSNWSCTVAPWARQEKVGEKRLSLSLVETAAAMFHIVGGCARRHSKRHPASRRRVGGRGTAARREGGARGGGGRRVDDE